MECLTPFYTKDKMTNQHIQVPCGQCPECIKRRISGWSYRLTKEGETAQNALFVTLTYNTDQVPITKRGYMSLEKTDLQKFLKRLRKYESIQSRKATKGKTSPSGVYTVTPQQFTQPIKYYACGEYGSIGRRPHYHLIIFNCSTQGIEASWQYKNNPIGDIHIGTVTGASIGYTLKYMCKGKTIPEHLNDDRQPEWSIMSKGLGESYLGTFAKRKVGETLVVRQSTGTAYIRPKYQKYIAKKSLIHKFHKKDLENRMYLSLPEGKKIALPKYYKTKIYTDAERQFIGNKVKQKLELEPTLTEEERVALVKNLNERSNKQRLTRKF